MHTLGNQVTNMEPSPELSGLPPLPLSHAPSSDTWDNRIAVCAIMKDENTDDVTEWLAYYRCAF